MNPLHHGIAGFIAQMRTSPEYNNNYEQVFSIYLSNDKQTPGDISFGGYNLEKYAKKGQAVTWLDQSSNENYWTVNSKTVHYNGKEVAGNR